MNGIGFNKRTVEEALVFVGHHMLFFNPSKCICTSIDPFSYFRFEMRSIVAINCLRYSIFEIIVDCIFHAFNSDVIKLPLVRLKYTFSESLKFIKSEIVWMVKAYVKHTLVFSIFVIHDKFNCCLI